MATPQVATPATLDLARLRALREKMTDLHAKMLALEVHGEDEIETVHPELRKGARNLVDYLALRQEELRPFQLELHEFGLSSLGAVNAHVLASVTAVIRMLDAALGESTTLEASSSHPTYLESLALLKRNADEALGCCRDDGTVRIMVTMPSEAADDPGLIHSFLEEGMTVVRINCAHDGPEAWGRMVESVRRAEAAQGRTAKIAFDLAGPKLRTGPVEPGPSVLRFKPARDAFGRVTAPATMRFGPYPIGDDEANDYIPVESQVCESAQPGDELHLTDTRGRKRELRVETAGPWGFTSITDRTVYISSGMELELRRDGQPLCAGRVGSLPPMEASIPLQSEDELILIRQLPAGSPAVIDEDTEQVLEPARIGCSLDEVFASAQPGERVFLDDGKFEGNITECSPDQIRIHISRAGSGSAKLKGEKGINLPDTKLDLAALTPKDLADLEFVVKHADLVSLSFVHCAADVEQLCEQLDRLNSPHTGIILKIENRKAFGSLPELLMTAMRRRHVAVMVARGDLGVEIGFERLAEVQEEMLWLCEAAHVPVIWATQVLDSLARTGLPSRGEVTDAAMSRRAECVMLNKGPFITAAIRFLTDVSRRMASHSSKTFATHRRLSVAASEWLAR